jgi:clan AA aspartic protease (TIGR02281 family)
MQRILAASAALVLISGLSPGGSSAAAEVEPTMKQIHEAATAGQLDRAQQMIVQVLANHPNSARAHYVQAELFAKEGKKAMAQSELDTAERLNPGLSEFSADSVRALKAQLGSRNPVRVPLSRKSGILVAPVIINGALKLDFMVDSGASEVSIPADVFSTLIRTNTVTQADMTGSRKYANADGETSESRTFVIRSLKIGTVEVANVEAKEARANAPLLLGQSFLRRFKSWSIDNATQELILER